VFFFLVGSGEKPKKKKNNRIAVSTILIDKVYEAKITICLEIEWYW
jgi:hypothetical protein